MIHLAGSIEATNASFRLVSTMDIGLQVSISETFNIVCADHVYMGIPIVTSKEISWMDTRWAVDPLDIDQIIKALLNIYEYPPHLRKYWDIFRLGRYNVRSGKAWLKYLGA